VRDVALVGGILLIGFVSAFVPIVSIELALVAAAATAGSEELLVAQMLAAATGQMLGKSCFFVGGRCAFLWARRKRADRPSRNGRASRLFARAKEQRGAAISAVFLSAFSGLPPFAVVSALAGTWRVRLAPFFVVGFAGRSARFAGVLFVPYLLRI
jgi:membrane protein YqaA with SNARE-associated domain